MRLRQYTLPPLSALPLFLFYLQTSRATPLSLNAEVIESANDTIVKRCENPCGYWGQLCCGAGESCFTDANNEAQCGGAGAGGGAVTTPAPAAGGSGYWQTYTSTWVETNLVTKTRVYSSFVAASATAQYYASTTAAEANCNWSSGESSCGNMCCPQGQYCQVHGQCAPAAGASVSAAVRPTSSGNVVVTQTSYSTTTTEPFETPIATGQSAPVTATSAQSSGGLSGGAIAGIVIAVIAGIILLLLLCLFLCFRSIWNAIFGGRRRKKTTEVYESYHRGGDRRSGDRRWYGNRPNRPDRRNKSNLGPVAAGLGGLAVALGLKRRSDRKKRDRREEKSDYTESSYSYSDYSYSGTSEF